MAALVAAFLAACGSGSQQTNPTRTLEATGSSVPIPMMLLDWGTSSRLRPIDPATAEDLPGYPPFDMGHWAVPLVSPDGKTLAAYIGPTQEPEGQLHFFDLASWAESFRLEEPTGNIHPLAWSPDSERLVFVSARRPSDPGTGLWVVDIDAQSAHRLADLDFWSDDLKVSPDGKTLYLFGFDQSDPTAFMVSGDPFLAAVDATSGEIKARVILPGVLVGQRHEEGPDGEFYATYLPARIMSPDGSRYYIVHPDSDQVTVVDLKDMAVERTVGVSRPTSPLSRLASAFLGVFVSKAEAKGGLFTSKQALMSPDGRWLYITGVQDAPPGIPPNGRTPVGLRIVDTRTMTVVHDEDGVGDIALSPDGRWLFGTGWSYEYVQVSANEYRPDNFRGWGFKVIDARSARLVASVGPEEMYQQMGVSPDGRYVHLVSEGPGIQAAAVNQGRCSEPCQILQVFDVDTRRMVAERPLLSYSAELVSSFGGW